MRKQLIGAAVLSTAFVLTGCLRFDADLTVQSDGLISGDFTLEISQEIAAFAGITSSEAFAEELASGELDEADALPAGEVDCEPVERTGAYAVTCTFRGADFSEPGELWWVTTDEESVTFHSRNESNPEDDASELFGDDFSLGSVNFEITMPGTITSVTGDFVEQTSDTTVRIESSLTDTFDIAVVSEKGSGGGVPIWLWVALGVLVLAAVVVVFIARSRKNHTRPMNVELQEVDGPEDVPPPAP